MSATNKLKEEKYGIPYSVHEAVMVNFAASSYKRIIMKVFLLSIHCTVI